MARTKIYPSKSYIGRTAERILGENTPLLLPWLDTRNIPLPLSSPPSPCHHLTTKPPPKWRLADQYDKPPISHCQPVNISHPPQNPRKPLWHKEKKISKNFWASPTLCPHQTVTPSHTATEMTRIMRPRFHMSHIKHTYLAHTHTLGTCRRSCPCWLIVAGTIIGGHNGRLYLYSLTHRIITSHAEGGMGGYAPAHAKESYYLEPMRYFLVTWIPCNKKRPRGGSFL